MSIKVEYKEMPLTVRGLTIENKDQYIIWINDGISKEQQERTYAHELQHIKNNDFEKQISVGKLESIRHWGDI